VDADDVLTDYYQLTRQETIPPVVIRRKRVRQELSPGPWIAAIVVIIVAAASYWWFAVYSSQQSAPATSPEEVPVEQQDDIRDEPAQPESSAVVERPEPEPVVTQTSPEPVDDEVEEGLVRLSLSFTGDCWTEVSDATGQRLFFEMGRSGTSVVLDGAAPFAVLFGDVDNVLVQVNGVDYPISSSSPGSRTARLTIMNP
jgi:cytoskeletal protein RodZ